MAKHLFLLTPGTWVGEGKIQLSMVEEELFFQTQWIVQREDFSGKIVSTQDVQIQGLADAMRNELLFHDFTAQSFTVTMENPNVGKIVGSGIFDEKVLGWEFRGNPGHFEGYETYTLQEDGSYTMKGEYVTSDQFRTHIVARLWIYSSETSSPKEENDTEEGS